MQKAIKHSSPSHYIKEKAQYRRLTMTKKLIITEKPSVAMDFAKVLNVSGRKDGFLENDEYVITWCVGHLVQMLYPESYDKKYKKWNLEDLPFLPAEYKYGVISKVRKQYNIVNKMLHRKDIDTVYWAGDSGKEGQTIEENIRRYGGVRKGMRELRVWINSQTEDEIKRGLREAKPMSDYDSLGNSGIMRAIEDYAIGINFSRALSVKYAGFANKAGNTSKYRPIAVGRVMTCVLGMVVDRELEIRNFTETPFFKIAGDFSNQKLEGEWKAVSGSKYFESPLLYRENGFKSKSDAQNLINELNGKPAIINRASKHKQYKNPPLLFNLAELQSECTKALKISPNQTLNIAQSLYEKKLITYPRTDSRHLSTSVAHNIRTNISGLANYTPGVQFVQTILNNNLSSNLMSSKHVNDNRVTDHYAIIPTGQIKELGSLNALEKQVFEIITKRFLSIFYPAAEYQTARLEIKIGDETFFLSSKKLTKEGFLQITGVPSNHINRSDAKNTKLFNIIDSLKEGQHISVNGFSVKTGRTVPPKRYTSGSMVLAMENAGKLIEDDELREQIKGTGIGTSATRAGIIQKLVRTDYLKLNKKTQVLTPSKFGEIVYDVVKNTIPGMLNPKMTASWEKGLEAIVDGSVSVDEFSDTLEDFITRNIVSIKQNDITGVLQQKYKITGSNKASGKSKAAKITSLQCPICSEKIVKMSWGWGCSGFKANGCKFSVSNKIASKQITDEQVEKLITTGSMGEVYGLRSKKGKTFSAIIEFDKNYKTVFVFN